MAVQRHYYPAQFCPVGARGDTLSPDVTRIYSRAGRVFASVYQERVANGLRAAPRRRGARHGGPLLFSRGTYSQGSGLSPGVEKRADELAAVRVKAPAKPGWRR